MSIVDLVERNLKESVQNKTVHILFELDTWSKDLNKDFTLDNCLFGTIKLSKNVHLDKYKYSGYIRGFTSRSELD